MGENPLGTSFGVSPYIIVLSVATVLGLEFEVMVVGGEKEVDPCIKSRPRSRCGGSSAQRPRSPWPKSSAELGGLPRAKTIVTSNS